MTLRPLLVAAALAAAALPASATADAPSRRAGLPLLEHRGSLAPSPAQERSRRALGEAEDAASGGVADLRRSRGFLTSRSARDAEAIALDYVRGHRAAFGLDDDDLDSLRRTARATSPSGITTVRWVQTDDGIASFDTGLIAHVDPEGRLIAIGGGAQPDFGARDTEPSLGPSAAYREALADVGAPLVAPRAATRGGAEKRTRFSDGGETQLALLADGARTRLVWRTLVADEEGLGYEEAIDADTGALVSRRPIAEHVANANVFPRFPGAPAGGAPVTVDLEADATWLNDSAAKTRLKGNNTHTYSDSDQNDAPSPGEDTASSGGDFAFTFTAVGGTPCPPADPVGDTFDVCTWNSADPSTLAINRDHAATNLFYNVNRWHDHLLAAPIGFDEASGNFERVNSSGQGEGGDSVQAENNDGPGFDNAFFNTPPDGTEPTMSMWPRTQRDLLSGHNAETAFHEYTHGLTNRLVVNAAGSSTLISDQARSMGEAWSDFYALDYLNSAGLLSDDDQVAGEVNYATYWNGTGIRSEAIDCRVVDSGGRCGSGGYTYEDIQVLTVPHTAGEMWAQTLWFIRYGVGSATARQLVTDALRISPPDPTYLDQRDAIIAADLAVNDGANYETLWTIFAQRGLGASATSPTRRRGSATEAFDLPNVDVGDLRTTAETAGDRDGILEPGESVELSPELLNTSFGSLGGASTGTLSSLTPGLTVPDTDGTWPVLAEDAAAFTSSPFAIAADAGVPCGTQGRLSLAITTTLGGTTVPLPVQIGPRGGSFDNALKVFDGFTTPSTITLPSGLGTVTDVDIFVDNVEHPSLNNIFLTIARGVGSPQRTLTSQPGGPGNNGDDIVDTVFDDEAAGPIPAGVGTITGRFKPTDPLSFYDGQPAGGTWTLRVGDGVTNGVEGVLHGWGINRPDRSACEDNTAEAASAPASAIGETAATLNADVNPDGVPTEFRFLYGPTDAYGSETPAQSAGGGTESAAIGGLAPGTTYHYRVQALRFGQVAAESGDATFTTATPPQEGPPPPVVTPPVVGPPVTPNTTPRFTRTAKSVKARKGRFAFVFDTAPTTSGNVVFRVGKTVLARSRFKASSAGRARLNVKLSKKAARTLKKRKKLRVVATVTAGATTRKVTFTLKR